MEINKVMRLYIVHLKFTIMKGQKKKNNQIKLQSNIVFLFINVFIDGKKKMFQHKISANY